jgi:hypothetical protein
LILSDQVGSKSQFLIEGYNGYSCGDDSVEQLALAMHRLSSLGDEKLLQMGQRSAQLASVLTPNIATASLMSVIHDAALAVPSAKDDETFRSDK